MPAPFPALCSLKHKGRRQEPWGLCCAGISAACSAVLTPRYNWCQPGSPGNNSSFEHGAPELHHPQGHDVWTLQPQSFNQNCSRHTVRSHWIVLMTLSPGSWKWRRCPRWALLLHPASAGSHIVLLWIEWKTLPNATTVSPETRCHAHGQTRLALHGEASPRGAAAPLPARMKTPTRMRKTSR